MHHPNKKTKTTTHLNLHLLDQQHLVPLLDRSHTGRGRLEQFSHYVARQLGFKDASECPHLCKLAYDYLKSSKDVDVEMHEYFANDPNANDLFVKLVEELDRCILSYFAFHWSQASQMISQVISENSDQKMLQNLVMSATRKRRFDKVAKDLKVTRVFSTLVEQAKAIGYVPISKAKCIDVMVPLAHNQRSPILLFMGGGMGAGKSTVLKNILKEPLWAATEAVVVEADHFKETDVIYRALKHPSDMLPKAEYVHKSSIDAASSVLVTALNKGRDVILDGTLSWAPFVEQTMTMARNVHKHRYRMGVGYKVEDDGTIIENYWEKLEEEKDKAKIKRPYRIEMVGVVCETYLAVVRGIKRAIQIGRAVRVDSQLISHKRFAMAFPKYCQLVDNARLYCTNSVGSAPALIGWKDGESHMLIHPDEIKCLNLASSLNDEAESIYELYTTHDLINQPGSVWNDFVMLPSRKTIQEELKATIGKIEIK